MKHTYIFYLLIFSMKTGAQNIHTPNNPTPYAFNFFYIDPWLENLNVSGKKIKQIKYTSTKYNDVNYTLLNENGQPVEMINMGRWRFGPFKFKGFSHTKYDYENGELTKFEILDEKGAQRSTNVYEYAYLHQIKHSQAFSKGKMTNESFTAFNTDSTQKEYVSYKVKHGKNYLITRYEFDYYPNKQKKQTRSYNGKNKLKHVWNFECDPKGKIEKNETKICVNAGEMNNTIVEVTFATTAKGKKTKHIHTYYVFNGRKVNTRYESYLIKNGKEIKQNDSHYADSLEPYYCYRSYDKHGRLFMERKIDYSVYDHAKQLISKDTWATYYKEKMSTRMESNYNEKGLPTLTASYNGKGKCIGKAEYKYEGDFRYAISHYNKKQKLTQVYSGEITYY